MQKGDNPQMTEVKFEKIYDLSVLVYEDMPLHPSIAAKGVFTKIIRHVSTASRVLPTGGPGRGTEPGWPIWHELSLSTHTGTHIDGPWHFNKYGRRIDEIPIDTYIGKGVVLDFRHLEGPVPIKAEDLEKARPEIEEGDIVIVNTGWHKKWGAPEYNTQHAGFDGESVGPYVVGKKVKMLGMDTMCVEPGSEESHWPHPLHRICLIENEIPLIENLGGQIDEVTGKRCFIIALPVKLMADSGIARVIALA
jgi:kynurenine formamidase